MDLGKALQQTLDGKRIRRKEWPSPRTHLKIINERLMIYLIDDEKYHPLIVSTGDIEADDWVVLEDKISQSPIPLKDMVH